MSDNIEIKLPAGLSKWIRYLASAGGAVLLATILAWGIIAVLRYSLTSWLSPELETWWVSQNGVVQTVIFIVCYFVAFIISVIIVFKITAPIDFPSIQTMRRNES